MSGLPSYDDDLLTRLNALKKSNIKLDSSKPTLEPSKPASAEDALSARLKGLRNGSSSSSPAPKPSTTVSGPPATTSFPSAPLDEPESDHLRHPSDLDDRTLDELLADLGPEDQWALNPDDPADIQKLLNEARSALPDQKAVSAARDLQEQEDVSEPAKPKSSKEYLARDLDLSAFALDDGEEHAKDTKHSNLEDESREAQDIVARLLDEVNLERSTESKDEKATSDDGDEKESSLSLPSAPTKLPDPSADAESSRQSLDFESDIAARMAALTGLGTTDALGLPSAPTFKPADKPVKGLMKKFTHEEVDTWCIICQDDATVKCLGCDGDLYCASCWKEGHMGPDVGYEEKMHKWTKYKKPN